VDCFPCALGHPGGVEICLRTCAQKFKASTKSDVNSAKADFNANLKTLNRRLGVYREPRIPVWCPSSCRAILGKVEFMTDKILVAEAFRAACLELVRNPPLLFNQEQVEEQLLQNTISWVCKSRGSKYDPGRQCRARVAGLVRSRMNQLQLEDDDFSFVARQEIDRVWTNYCVMCLEENASAGKACSCCDVKNFAMFVPCGHTVCKRPCYERFRPQDLMPSRCLGETDVHLKEPFDCPMCRQQIRQVIETSKVRLPERLQLTETEISGCLVI
jgi:hypothetical protein